MSTNNKPKKSTDKRGPRTGNAAPQAWAETNGKTNGDAAAQPKNNRARTPAASDPRALLVSNISFNTTPAGFEAHMKQAQGVSRIEFRVDSNNKPAGTAVVIFDTVENASNAVKKMNGVALDGRQLVVQPNVPKPKPKSVPNAAASDKDIATVKTTGSLFVSNLAPETTEDDLLKYFSTRGVVNECRVLQNPKTSKSLGTAVVVFLDPEVAVLILKQTRPLVLHNRNLRISAQAATQNLGSESMIIHIQHPVTMTKVDIISVFQPFGDIVSVKVISDRLYGFTILQYSSAEAAQQAISSCNDRDISDHGLLTVMPASVSTFPHPSRQQHHHSHSHNHSASVSSDNKAILDFFNNQLELCIQQKPLKCTSQDMTNMTEQGAKLVGDGRARLLFVWYYLLQDSERPGVNHGVNPRSNHIQTFRDIFIHSNALEHLVANSFEHPFSTPVSTTILPKTCTLSVSELVLKVFSKVLVGPPGVHKDLLALLEHLSIICQLVSPQLRQHVSRLVTSFQLGADEISKNTSQPVDVQKELALIDSLDLPQQVSALQRKWQGMFKDHGMGGLANVASVFQSISSEIEKLKVQSGVNLDAQRLAFAAMERSLAQIRSSIKIELGTSGPEYDELEKRAQTLKDQKQNILNEISIVVQQLEAAQDDQERLVKQNRAAHSRLQPKMSSHEADKRAALKEIDAFEQRGQLLNKSKTLLGNAHAYLCKRINENNASRSVVPGELAGKTVTVATKCLLELLENTKKHKARRDIFTSKLAKMKAEQQELISLGLTDVAKDITRGGEKISQDMAVLAGEMQEQVREAENTMNWLLSVRQTNVPQDQFDTAQVQRVFAEIKRLAAS